MFYLIQSVVGYTMNWEYLDLNWLKAQLKSITQNS